ncbi:hypothetical protein [Mucilaginibacter sp. CSA2-8R]|uniref:hypothetical protein n=1 Tax=Mucilaginibacter sp. CSA2-8R TaxID=3141542 RepID=UPI00315CDE9A
MRKVIFTLLCTLLISSAFAQFNSSRDDRAYWNGFVDYVQAKGFTGSKDMNRRDLNIAEKLFHDYNAVNKRSVDYKSFVTLVQRDIQQYRKQALDQIKISRVKHAKNSNYPLMFKGTDEQFMAGLSVVDGFAGVQTTAWRFPNEIVLGLNELRFNDIYATNSEN